MFLDFLVALYRFCALYHCGQWSREYRIACLAARYLYREFGISRPMDYPVNGRIIAFERKLIARYA